MNPFTYDLAVIGSGPGGYVAALRAAQLGLKTALIEKYSTLGGTCLNVGCIPSKALLYSSEYYHQAKNKFSEHGIEIKDLSLDFAKMISRKDKIIDQTCSGIQFLMNKNKIKVFQGLASFESKHQISILKSDHPKEKISFKNAIIATGSKPIDLPFCKIDKKRILSSTEALSLKEIPKHLIIIGAGVIGLELGSLYKKLGSKVSIIEYSEKIIPQMEEDLSKELYKILTKLDVQFYLSTLVEKTSFTNKEVLLEAKKKNQERISITGDYLLLAVGRKPYTLGLNLEKIGIEKNDKGFIRVNGRLQTNIENIYAIGDVIEKGPMLAHKASEEGIFVAENLVGQMPHLNYDLIPSVVYTWPEVASVGKTTEQLKKESISHKIGKFPIKALGISRASLDIDGFVKVLSDSKTDEILGIHIIGPRAADLIMEAVVAMEFRASAEDLARISHPHPSFSEALKEASLGATENRMLHI